MKKNVGSIDRVIRILIGLALLALVFVGPQTPWGWLGLVAIATAGMSWCPLYTLLGIKTCASSDKEPDQSHVL